MSTRKRKKCLTCSKDAVSRGLCPNCRAAARAAIGRGETTEAELEACGLMLPVTRTGRPPASAFVRALRRSK